MKKRRLPSFDFEKMGLIGQTLYFAPDRRVTAKVVSARKFEYRGSEVFQVEAARRAAKELGLPVTRNGTPLGFTDATYWETEDGTCIGYIWGETAKRIWPEDFH